MKLLDLTLDTPAENLALDEALLEEAEEAARPMETLRLWESPRPLVVVGRSSRVEAEVNVAECRGRGVPILRRCSGGAAVVAGPGCLMYGVVLSYELRPALRLIDQAHRFVLQTLRNSLRSLHGDVRASGISDLTLTDRKFSGNSLRCKRTHLLYHGTLLYDFPLELIAACLRRPPREPKYRGGRRHEDFVTNLPVSAAQLRKSLVDGWAVTKERTEWPREATRHLAEKMTSASFLAK